MPVQIIYQGKAPVQMLAAFKALKNDVLPLVGNEALRFVDDNFDKEGFHGDNGFEKWKPRKNETEQTTGKKILDRNGHLRNLVDRRIQGNTITIYWRSPARDYAAVHNEGGTTHPHVTDKSRAWAWAMYKRTGLVKYKAIAKTKKTTLTVTIPQRKFIGNSKKLDERIINLLTSELSRVFSGK